MIKNLIQTKSPIWMFHKRIFGNLNFSEIQSNPDFKEDSVREVIIYPILEIRILEWNYRKEQNIGASLFNIRFNKLPHKKVFNY